MWIATVAIHASRSRNLICTNKLKKYGADRRWKHPRKQRLEKCWTHCTRSLSNMRTLYTCIKENQQWIIDFETLITGRIWHLKICKFYLTRMGYLWKRTHVAFGWKIEKKFALLGKDYELCLLVMEIPNLFMTIHKLMLNNKATAIIILFTSHWKL